MNSINKSIIELLSSILCNIKKYKKEIIAGLHILLNGNYIKYNIDNLLDNNSETISNEEFQEILFSLNEKSGKRRTNGVYYTPNDVVKYILCNALIMRMYNDSECTHNTNDCIELLKKLSKDKLDDLIFKYSVIDPTCGSGEYLFNVFYIKYLLLCSYKKISDDDILNICKTIYGNDIDDESTDISKIRLYFFAVDKLTEKESINKLARILKKQFYNYDYIINSSSINKKYDIIVGNPPYVEYGKFDKKELLHNSFGNIYADVIKNSIDMLKRDGVIGYIIPLSYTATSRMSKIRYYVMENMNKQFILNFADRPDCLFNGVHQKLNIIIARKGISNKKVFTSNYKHWYKNERSQLLNGREVVLCNNIYEQFIPKFGNKIEKSIFNKIFTMDENNIYDLQSSMGNSIYLNMRACFWIKAFSFNPGSNEYKQFIYSKKISSFIGCLLNSNLFWLYWTMISDCWHITSKELKYFSIPKNSKNVFDNKFNLLFNELESKLETTKKYVGTKQAEYEYKHKLCKDIIDKIDNEIAKVYNLSNEELDYIQKFAIKYRMSGDIDD